MKKVTSAAVSLVLFAAAAWLVWQWFFCRFYVPINCMAVITAKTGAPLPPGQILAQKGQKGVQEDVLGEGRHFLNPFLYEHDIVPVTIIPAGKVGVVTSKVGNELPAGEFLADPGQKGIWRKILGPGKYRMNPVGYRIDIIEAISIPIGYDGVITSLSGKQAAQGQFAAPDQKGVRQDILQPGLYYINPREFSVNVLEIGVNQVSLLGKKGSEVITKGQIVTQNRAMEELQRSLLMEQQEKRAGYLSKARAPAPAKTTAAEQPREAPKPLGDESISTFVLNQFVEFPSRDGFEISLDMTVEFELLPKYIAWMYRSYGDLPAAVDKIIMPQILSVSRLKGSAYGARDFIVGEGREKFQNDLTEALARTLAERRIIVHSALIRHVNVPMQILDPIQQASIAQEQDLTNEEKQNTAKKMAQLNTELSLIEQRREQVAQETKKIKAEIGADQEKQVAEIRGNTLKRVAQIEKETAGVRAEKTVRLGRAESERIRMVEGERARGFQLKVKAFGEPMAYNLWTLADGLSDQLAVNILHAGDGTLWTDLEKARLGDLGGARVMKGKK
ncbi:SPFH domain-containing protein [Desulfoferrobacter suflitae]|uniref:SPFH domain-containing protein n=1 Tax=Desulfoferrobacter suflitae TaxID=2865782 RepID=UPI0021643A41|nr:SPFH domain-containing protein [Desulfoferrobacter suflitae]MCK8602997.1 SPFH domain-containing protein [Desulfoferrobacter suflitae]